MRYQNVERNFIYPQFYIKKSKLFKTFLKLSKKFLTIALENCIKFQPKDRFIIFRVLSIPVGVKKVVGKKMQKIDIFTNYVGLILL